MTALIILPGLDGLGLMHDDFIAALGPGYDVKAVLYPNQPGLSYNELEILASAALPESGPFILLGESFSGPLAIRLAAANPERTLGLILCVSFVRNPYPVLAWLRPLIRILPVAGAPVALVTRLVLGKAVSAGLRQSLAELLARISPDALRARLRAVLAIDVSTEFAALKLPVPYLRGKYDRIVPRRASELAARLNPRMRIAEFPSSHLLLQTAPREAAQAVVQFVHEIAHPPVSETTAPCHDPAPIPATPVRPGHSTCVGG